MATVEFLAVLPPSDRVRSSQGESAARTRDEFQLQCVVRQHGRRTARGAISLRLPSIVGGLSFCLAIWYQHVREISSGALLEV